MTCPCGGIILADTEEWKVPLCYECYTDLLEINVKAKEEISRLDKDIEILRIALNNNPLKNSDHT